MKSVPISGSTSWNNYAILLVFIEMRQIGVMVAKEVFVGSYQVGSGNPLLFLSGPCVMESEEHTLRCAEQLVRITENLEINFVFKASYDKANRSSSQSFRGPGLEQGLRILEKVKKEFDIPVVSDVHSKEEAIAAAEVLDLIQIPAFLCRQTDLIIAAGKTGKPVQVKKGQFLAPWDMCNVVNKLEEIGCDQILLCDRGVSFGYNNLVSDMRAIPVMQKTGYPVVFDAGHSVQLPGGLGDASGGERCHIPVLARAAVAAGADGIFLESHPTPESAKSDAASVYALDDLPELLAVLLEIYQAVHPSKTAVYG